MINEVTKMIKIGRIWTLTGKNLELYFRKGPVIIFGLLFPFFMGLSWVIGRVINSIQLLSGILGMTVFFLSTAMAPVVIPWETREKNLEMIFTAPITLLDLLISIGLASTIYSLLISTMVCIVLIFVLNISASLIGWFFIGSLLLSWSGSYLAILVSAIPTDLVSNVNTIMTLIKFPLIFISGIFIPLEELPSSLFILSLFSPVTYFVDLLKSCNASGFLGLAMDLIMLVIWSSLIFFLTYLAHKRTLLARF